MLANILKLLTGVVMIAVQVGIWIVAAFVFAIWVALAAPITKSVDDTGNLMGFLGKVCKVGLVGSLRLNQLIDRMFNRGSFVNKVSNLQQQVDRVDTKGQPIDKRKFVARIPRH